jgi:hypothetical protein
VDDNASGVGARQNKETAGAGLCGGTQVFRRLDQATDEPKADVFGAIKTAITVILELVEEATSIAAEQSERVEE